MAGGKYRRVWTKKVLIYALAAYKNKTLIHH
ncbi:MAG: hypothetical protein ACI845_004143 [Gammaproteobacteria bacterium]|jgi:hypothetical protein